MRHLFGRPPDVVVADDVATWRLSDRGWVYVVCEIERAGKALITLLVDDLERYLAELNERGIAIGDAQETPGRYRRAVISDPEGNTIALGEDLSAKR